MTALLGGVHGGEGDCTPDPGGVGVPRGFGGGGGTPLFLLPKGGGGGTFFSGGGVVEFGSGKDKARGGCTGKGGGEPGFDCDECSGCSRGGGGGGGGGAGENFPRRCGTGGGVWVGKGFPCGIGGGGGGGGRFSPTGRRDDGAVPLLALLRLGAITPGFSATTATSAWLFNPSGRLIPNTAATPAGIPTAAVCGDSWNGEPPVSDTDAVIDPFPNFSSSPNLCASTSQGTLLHRSTSRVVVSSTGSK